MKPVYIFYHMFCINDCISKFKQAYTKITASGLLEITTTIYVILVGDNRHQIYDELSEMYKVTPIIKDSAADESETLKFLWDKCNEEDCNVLYMHGKGVSRGKNIHIDSWVNYMEYFCINHYAKCIRALKVHDTCGVNLAITPMKHYSGNFWWATSEFIRTRDRYNPSTSSNIQDKRWYCEFWLLDTDKCNPTTLHQSTVDHYCTIYEKQTYMHIGYKDWNKPTLDVPSAWKGLERYIPSIITEFNIKPHHCLEFGVDEGYSSHVFSQLFDKVTGVDMFAGDIHIRHDHDEHFYPKIKHRFNNTNVDIIKSDFRDFIKNNTTRYDLIHVDIVHLYDDTFECTDWAVQQSDVVILHDTCSFPSINQVCVDIAAKHNIGYNNIPHHHGLGILYKKSLIS